MTSPRLGRPLSVGSCYTVRMAVELLRETGGKTAVVDNLPLCEKVTCTQCSQAYQFRYSSGESHRVKEWLTIAQAAVNRSHSDGHARDSLPVSWRIGVTG